MREFRLHGPPGTGKTHSLAHTWIPRAVERFGRKAVVACSLTKAAAKELVTRTPLPRQNVGTLHALCYRLLGAPQIAETAVEGWNTLHPSWALTPSHGTPDGAGPPRGGDEGGDALFSATQNLRHNLVPPDRWPPENLAFHAAWAAWMEEEGLLDFTGLIERALRDAPACPGRPAVLIVDEAQDCSALELALVRSWGRSCAYVVLAGDADQAIYGWRGASSTAFDADDLPPENHYDLAQSYRCPRAVHACARAWIGQIKARRDVPYAPRDAAGVLDRGFPASWRTPHQLADALEATSGTAMALAACQYLLGPLVHELREAGVPYHNPYRKASVAWNPLTGVSRRLTAFLRPARALYGAGAARLWTPQELWGWVEVLDSAATGLPRGCKRAVSALAKEARKSEGRPEPVPHSLGRDLLGPPLWRELMAVFQGETYLSWFRERLLASRAAPLGYALRVAARDMRALLDTPRVVVGTIHSVKGGEADHVYLMPDLSRAGGRAFDRGGPERDEIVRTFYVGMTRAREGLHLLGAGSRESVEGVW